MVYSFVHIARSPANVNPVNHSSAQVSRSHRDSDSRLSQRGFSIKPTVNQKVTKHLTPESDRLQCSHPPCLAGVAHNLQPTQTDCTILLKPEPIPSTKMQVPSCPCKLPPENTQTLRSSSSLARSSAQVFRSHRDSDSRLSQRGFLIKPTVNPKKLLSQVPSCA